MPFDLQTWKTYAVCSKLIKTLIYIKKQEHCKKPHTPPHLLCVPGDPGVQQQLQARPVVPPGGFHRNEQVGLGEMLHRGRGSVAPRGAAHRSPLPGESPDISGENPGARLGRILFRVSACDHQHPGHEEAGDCGCGGERSRWTESRGGGWFPHSVGVDSFTASLMDRNYLLCSLQHHVTPTPQVSDRNSHGWLRGWAELASANDCGRRNGRVSLS